MKLVILSCFLLMHFVLNAQSVKRMKIDELESFIASRAHPAVINFWATWCAPCVEEMPWFNKMLAEKRHKNIELVFVSLDNPKTAPQKIDEFIQRKKLDATFIWLQETNADVFCPRIEQRWGGTIPATLFINHKSHYRKFVEAQISPSLLRRELHRLGQ
jgi:thiol-disulfide isomerase/thioredoxin